VEGIVLLKNSNFKYLIEEINYVDENNIAVDFDGLDVVVNVVVGLVAAADVGGA
jgi:multisubunit Na+/H+ antiporter MnhB subunit